MTPTEVFTKIFKYINNFDSILVDGKGMVPVVLCNAKFSCDNSHIIDKYLGYHGTSEERILELYAHLTDENREAFINWIMDNYNG